MKRVTILGATGSVGRSTAALIEAAAPGAFEVEALVAGRDAEGLAAMARKLGARRAVLADPQAYGALAQALAGSGIEAAAGSQAVLDAAAIPVDWTMAAIVGAAGLGPVLAALSHGGTLALANKEALVCAAPIVFAAAKASGARILTVDSEHNAIFQVLEARDPAAIAKIIITASGGPFRMASMAEMAAATPEMAVRHPVWSMGAKISVDSATMMNKGLELIEAARLFPVPEERIEVLVHPQSAVHGLVQYVDGSLLAQLGTPDMRTPIAHALAWPERMAVDVAPLDLAALGRLEFFPPDTKRFPALRLAREALRAGEGATTILNAANEVAVSAFLERRLSFLGIASVVEAVLQEMGSPAVDGLEAVLGLDEAARVTASRQVLARAA
ncbi:1-deoxy-D-xylulose-5-phosphate reductoisomerase [Acetobacteraceae bacterium H6797]|nr:1-deoxy-D-xylulose-5-phosphate reductoisomerase [Acetobacteraceae bacterium H6797]